jgi:hypothetical protein
MRFEVDGANAIIRHLFGQQTVPELTPRTSTRRLDRVKVVFITTLIKSSASGQDTGFFEAEISLTVGQWLAYDHMIE